MQANFDFIAPFYDSLARLVFGKALQKAKTSFTDRIPTGGRLLLMGGGTGTILNTLLKTHPALEIDFVDVSGKMLKLAENNLDSGFHHRVTFIHGDHHAIQTDKIYDAATSFFVIDCMRQWEATEFTTKGGFIIKARWSFLVC
jgi:ubiquinone/menaquinone biosynthesis C-methylase UbiE